jgi:L-rhamnose mutarotase
MKLKGLALGFLGGLIFLAATSVRKGPAASPKVQRFGQIIALKPDKLAYYKELHAAVWPSVLKQIKSSHIRNYSIYLKEVEKGKFYLFAYFEYTGGNFTADMAKMAADPETKRWWKETDPCQTRIPLSGEKDWWSAMEEVFHTD